MKKYVSPYNLEIIGAIAGAVGGYLYWKNVGCISGTCAITSSPIISTAYGALLGALFLGMFKSNNRNKEISDK
ncbi:MAG: hypothetical protein IPO27_08945 [Bacteroidetes bacterium]|nr:hypothetical protein [Bacteroidota bacterium]